MDTRTGCSACGIDIGVTTHRVINGRAYCLKCAETVQEDTHVPAEVSTAHECIKCGTILVNGACPLCTLPPNPYSEDAQTIEAVHTLDSLLNAIASQSHFEERYTVQRELARGGMGVVLHAFDRVLQREVALKMMLQGGTDPRLRGQFLKEARVGGRLLHPNLLAVFDLGVNQADQIYYSMRLVDGASLQRSVDAVQEGVSTQMIDFPLRKLVEALAKACDGIDFAHQNRVLHLDIKPQNILVSGFNEVFVIDWGLARVDDLDDTQELIDLYERSDNLDHTASATMAVGTGPHRVVGTPSYMAPEQASGAVQAMGAATDIYALGGVLHFILYQCAPNRGNSPTEILDSASREKERQPLREGITSRKRRIPIPERQSIAQLEDICLKALTTHPEQRHTNAAELALDLREWLSQSQGIVPH